MCRPFPICNGIVALLISGSTADGTATLLYRNDLSASTPSLTPVAAPFAGTERGDIHWVDLNGDAALDVIAAGNEPGRPVLRAYLNRNGTFESGSAGFPSDKDDRTYAAIIDVNTDGSADVMLSQNLFLSNTSARSTEYASLHASTFAIRHCLVPSPGLEPGLQA